MNLGNLVLDKIKAEKSDETKPKDKLYLLNVAENDCQVQIKYKDVDKLGIVLEYLIITRGTPVLDVRQINLKLEKQSEMVQKNITYLLEDFKLIELDRLNKKAQLRSYPPHQKEDSKYFYEIILDDGNRVHFQRYAYSPAKRRYEKITSQLTLESFVRLVDDLSALLCKRT